MRVSFAALLVCISCFVQGQSSDSTFAIATKWADSFVEWEFYDSIESSDPIGELTMRWINQNDWTKWDFRIGEYSGEIRTQWPDRLDEWILTSEGETVTMKTRWRDDFSEWRVTDSEDHYILSLESAFSPEEWRVQYRKELTFEIYTEVEGDLRSWLVYQEGGLLPRPTQMALMFAALISSVPKY